MSESSSGRRFHVIFEHSPIGIVVMEATGIIQYANTAVRAFLGVDEDELSGELLASFAYEEDLEFFQTLFSELVEGERDEFQLVSRCRVHRDRIAWWRVDMRAVRISDGSPFILAVVDDVTSQKNDEERLRRAKDLAEAATRTKSAFLANMSHEIRTPLHTINGMAELLRETNLDEEQLEYLHQIQFANEVLLGLINDILDFSKIEAGRLQLESIEFDPVEMIEDAVDMVSMQAHRKGLEVVLYTDDRLPRRMKGDPSRLRQVLVNLVNNAVKFTDKGSIRVGAELRNQRGVRRMIVQVKDTGIGIPKERQAVLFKPFTQVDASMTRKFGGTGLGLSISRDLVNMMGGRIGVKSKPDVGSNFWFTVPIEMPSLSTAIVSRPEVITDGFRVLLIDDNRQSASTIATYLERWKIDTTAVGSASAGLAAMSEAVSSDAAFDLTLIDLRLPDMDGWQLASEIRNDPLLEKTPLVLMSLTGLSTRDAKMKLLHWFDAYINKPVKQRELASAFEEVFSSDIEELEAIDGDQAPDDTSVWSGESDLPHTVLVAEDHFVNQELFRTILEKKGFRTFVASDGVEAVEIIRNHPEIGLIFMDVQMPNLNGFDATTKVRRLGILTPIVAVTANALSGDRERCIRVGMNDYMAKPFKNADIEAVLSRLRKAGAFEAGHGLRQTMPTDEPHASVDTGAIVSTQTSADSESTIPIDVSATIDAFMGDIATVERIVRKFAASLETQIDKVEEHLRSGRITDARIVAHAIKGGAWNLSSPDLGEAAKAVEDACVAEDGEAAHTLLSPLRDEARRFERFVSAFDFSTVSA